MHIPLHTFHIPVMGLAYTIDSPIKVARFGIASVISVVEDRLVEMMRRHYYPTIHQAYFPIRTQEPDYRARRITDYLNLVNTIVESQVEKLRKSAFDPGSEIVQYFEMLPEESTLKQRYLRMLQSDSYAEKEKTAFELRRQIQPGSIDVNIMTKIDRDTLDRNGRVVADSSDAVTALRGYINSRLENSSLVLSAGMNPRLYNYLGNCTAFDPDENGKFSKKITIKVSDFRSALIQGKYLAKRGIWVSEFRIESGLNCGGHAFATDGFLLGPILEEFKQNRQQLVEALFELYAAFRRMNKNEHCIVPPSTVFSVQGGIGTFEEDTFLRRYYRMESTGWGTPFLLVPEATTVDAATLSLLAKAGKEDLQLSNHSPMGVRFYNLKGTSAGKEKAARIRAGKPGSPCTEKHLAFNTEFTKEPICTASRRYQKLKIAQLQSLHLPEPDYEKQLADVLGKECLCIGLSNAAAHNYNEVLIKKLDAVTICPGPNITNFSRIVTLQTMTDHIYGRTNIMTRAGRPHMFIAELNLYINYLEEELEKETWTENVPGRKKYFNTFCKHLQEGIDYYRTLSGEINSNLHAFISGLDAAEVALTRLGNQFAMDVPSGPAGNVQSPGN